MMKRPEPVETAEELAAEARGLLRRKRWTDGDAALANELLPSLIEEGLDELADRLIYAIEQYEVRLAASGG